MPTFQAAIASVQRKPAHVVTLKPDSFQDGCPTKPRQAVAVGLSLLSEADLGAARAEAVKIADRDNGELSHSDEDWISARNDALIRVALSRSLCEPNNAEKTYFDNQDEDTLARYLTSPAVRHLWDELERASIMASPVRAEAEPDEIADLAKLLASGLIEDLGGPQRTRLKKLCSFMLDELLPLVDEDDEIELDVAVS
jgi:hypothetical protein